MPGELVGHPWERHANHPRHPADFILWDTPTSMIPTHARVWEIAADLASRRDVADPIVQAALIECWKFLGFDSMTSH